MQGRPPTARLRPPAGAAARRGGACGHGGLRPAHKGGSRPQRDAFKGASCRATYVSGGRQRPTRKRLPLAASPQATTASGQPARGYRPRSSRNRRLPTACL
ncbi:hypothetical protein BHE74_00058975 [Ensete ventricosum]|nr:hypothetical protein GW17_00032919 [Ensete ventricosum]RWW36035.1 hypothetical protein BHE74_00058975 [Ensete ventricosum]RZS26188.1 hypothetical protein BHM03_00059498 [Ensete ventricosum]